MKKGDTARCKLLGRDNRPTGGTVRVTICEVKHHWESGAVLRARVKSHTQPPRFLWVQGEMLTLEGETA